MLEKQIEKFLVDEVRKMGGIAYKFVSPGNDGVPDRIVVIDGHVIFVELKTETGKLTEIQKRQIERLKKCGAKVEVLKGADDVKNFLDMLRNITIIRNLKDSYGNIPEVTWGDQDDI